MPSFIISVNIHRTNATTCWVAESVILFTLERIEYFTQRLKANATLILNRSCMLQVLLCLVAAAWAQFEAGFVKILQDKRYQEGSTFGNFRDQEDGIKYFEETDAHGVRRGYWEYPSEGGQVLRTEFEGT